MTIKVGDKIPSVMLKRLSENGLEDVSTEQVFKNQRVVMFAVPGAFTPTCSAKHLPGFVDNAAVFKSKGIDQIVCLAVNDPFVMDAWIKQNKADKALTLLPDGNGAFTRALGLELDGTGYGLGQRAQRFGLVAENGVVTALYVEKPGQLDVSSAEAMLKAL